MERTISTPTFQDTHKEWSRLGAQLAKECISYIKSILDKLPNKEVYVNGEEYEYYPCYVTYDGGNHPEYAANPYSQVGRVFLNELGHIRLDTEDCSDYVLEDLACMEIYAVADAVEAVVNREYDLEE